MSKKQHNALSPSLALLAKLGSIIVHTEEAMSFGAHSSDWTAIKTLLDAPDVQAWLEQMRTMAMVPVKRSERSKGRRP